MTYDTVNQVWTITLDLVAGEMKFRFNDDWAVNLGDNDADGSVEQDGANIAMAAAGNYTITLNLKADTFNIVQN